MVLVVELAEAAVVVDVAIAMVVMDMVPAVVVAMVTGLIQVDCHGSLAESAVGVVTQVVVYLLPLLA